MTATYQVLVDDPEGLGVEQVFGLMSDDTAVFATALDSPASASTARVTRTTPSPWPRAIPTAPEASAWP